MEIKEIIASAALQMPEHIRHCERVRKCEAYYHKQNDILSITKSMGLSTADSRLCSNYYRVDVTQKTGYMFTRPPKILTGDPELDTGITRTLGAYFAEFCRDVSVWGCHAGTAWGHYWAEDGRFMYAAVDPKNILPVYSQTPRPQIEGVVHWELVFDTDGTGSMIIDVWNSEACYRYVKPASYNFLRDEWGQKTARIDSVQLPEPDEEPAEVIIHGFGEIPFIPFKASDGPELYMAKDYIDALDLMQSQFVDNLQAFAEAFYILSGYDGEDEESFLRKVQEFKVVIMQQFDFGGNQSGGLETVTTEIPVEARTKIIDYLRTAIIENMMMYDPDPEVFGNASGVALNHKFRNLELKCGETQTGFEPGFDRLAKAALRFIGVGTDSLSVEQVWTRNKMDGIPDKSAEERIAMARDIAGLNMVSDQTIMGKLLYDIVPDPEAERELYNAEHGLPGLFSDDLG